MSFFEIVRGLTDGLLDISRKNTSSRVVPVSCDSYLKYRLLNHARFKEIWSSWNQLTELSVIILNNFQNKGGHYDSYSARC